MQQILQNDPNGMMVNRLSVEYGATWSYTNLPTTFLFDRGYTGHEHLDKFGLINMNGRVFDPFLARFLSPDPILQDLGNSQSHNRYSYCLNNPLKYTDPSGYKPVFDPCSPPPWNIWNPGGGPGGSWTGGGLMGFGSINHWSNNYRDRVGMFMFMPMHTFDNMIAGAVNNPNYFENIAIPYAKSNGICLYGEAAANIWSGWSLAEITDFGRTEYVAYLGDLGTMKIENGGYIFSNKSAGVLLTKELNVIALAGGGNFDNSNLALDIGGGIFGGLRIAVTPGDQWLGSNGKYYNKSWGGNQYAGSRSGAFSASKTYKWAGRATVGAIAIIGGIQVYNGYQMDGGQFGYNANLAGASATGGIIGGWAGAQAGAYSFGIAGGLIGGPPGAVFGAVIGGFVGGFWGGYIGGNMGESLVNYYYGR